MSLLRTLARALLSSIFIFEGVDAIRKPRPKAEAIQPIIDEAAVHIDGIPDDTELLVRVNGAVQVVAGAAFAAGFMRRQMALVLAGSLVPTTLAAHRFWNQNGDERATQLQNFMKNAGLLGGLAIASMDTQGQPGLAWKAQHALDHINMETEHKKQLATLQTELVAERAAKATAETRATAGATAIQAREDVQAVVSDAKQRVRVGAAMANAAAQALGNSAARLYNQVQR